MPGGNFLPRHTLLHQLHGLGTDRPNRLGDGRQPWSHYVRPADVVEPGDRHILRHPDTLICQVPDRADSDQIVTGHYQCGLFALLVEHIDRFLRQYTVKPNAHLPDNLDLVRTGIDETVTPLLRALELLWSREQPHALVAHAHCIFSQ